MNEITVSAKTVNDAITEASIQLGVTSDQMEYDVIEKGSAGFFGIGSKQAVIRARLKKAEEPKAEEVVEKKPEEKKFENKKNSEKKEFKKEHKEHKEHKEYKEHKEHKECKEHKEVKKQPQKKEAVAEVTEEKKEIEIAVVTEETMKICEEFLIDVLKAMGMEGVEILSKVDEDGALSIEMKGDNMGILIGKRGQTLDSLQYLTNRVANKSQDGYVRVKLDTEDYRRSSDSGICCTCRMCFVTSNQ